MNKAFVAASVAEKDGFMETAKAFRDIALEAFLLMNKHAGATVTREATSTNLKLLTSVYF